MKLFKKPVLIVTILIAVGLLVCIVPLQNKIDTKLDGVQCRILEAVNT